MVAPGITLTIQAGTVVKFDGNYNLNVEGTLIADGTETQPILFMSNTDTAIAPVFSEQTGASNPFNGMDVGDYSTPTFVDIDGDGDMDAFIGVYGGIIEYYKNSGTTLYPSFSEQTGTRNPFYWVDVGFNSTPAFVDIDGDGDMDAFIGKENGEINYFKNTGTALASALSQQTGTNNPLNGVDVGDYSTPTFVDIDQDGDMDAFIGELDGILNYYKNTGTALVPAFSVQTGTSNPFNGVDVGFNSTPAFVDIDGDEDMDAFLGELDGILNYYKNNGTALAPAFSVQTGTSNPFNGVDVGDFSTPAFVDIDGDGDMDAFSGEEYGTLKYFKNTGIWGRIFFDDPSVDVTADISGTYQAGNLLRWVQVEKASQGIACNSATPYISHVTLNGGGMNCTPGGTTLWLQDSSLAGGVTIGGGGQVWRNTITRGGLSLNGQATARENHVSSGISTGSNSLVQDNIAGGTITAPGASQVSNNMVTGGGITSGSSALVQDNQVSGGSITSGISSSVMSNTLTSGGITIGASSTASRNNIENTPGWGISNSGSVTLTYNRLVGGANGISLSGGVMQNNLVANNSGVGLQINGNSTVISNTFTGNHGNTIKLTSATNLLINGNNLEGNKGQYDIENLIPKTTYMTIPTQYNWWGTTISTTIYQRIFDINDDDTKGQILYDPKTNSSIQSAPAYVRSVIQDPGSPVGIETVTFDVNFNRPMNQDINPNMVIGDDFPVAGDTNWISPTLFRASYDVTTLIPRGIYELTITGAVGSDAIEIAPSSQYTLTIDYAGAIGDTTPPPPPEVMACAYSIPGTLWASYFAQDPDSMITLYSYAIGTAPGGSDIINWTNTASTSFVRSSLGLISGHTYYVSVKARNAGGLWSTASTPPGVIAGSNTCTATRYYVYLPLTLR